MSGWVLLIIGLVSLALVVAVLAVMVLKGWHVAKHGMAVSRSTGWLAADVAARAQRVEISADRLQTASTELQANLARLHASAERLRILTDALSEAMAPYRSLRAFLGK